MDITTLKIARMSAKLTLIDVGGAASLDPSSVFHYEHGTRRPSPEALARWRGGLVRLLIERQRRVAVAVAELMAVAS